ncbi:MAG: hypothetical protein KBS84_00825 [Treponema sp.]|nr:hypothetical protein [Candidatus Treponema scatequi]
MKTINKNICFIAIATLISIFTGCNYQGNYADDIVIYVDKRPGTNNYGYKYIDPNENLSESFLINNMIYYINDEIDLKTKTITIAEDSILLFGDNGKIKNGKIVFNKTFLDGSVNFSQMRYEGTLINKTCRTSWFGLNKTDAEENSAPVKNDTILSEIFSCIGPNLIIDGLYPLSSTVTISTKVTMIAPDWSMSCLKSDYNYTYTPTKGFYTTSATTTLFSLTNTSSVNAYGIYFKGKKENYIGKTIPGYVTSAFALPLVGSLGSLYNCKIEGFGQGIRGVGGFIEKIQNTTFDSCRIGLYIAWTSDFDVFGCKFINCLPNLEITDSKTTLTEDNLNDLRHAGAAIWACCAGMVNFANNYYENNFIDFVASEADIIINVTDSTFKNPTFANFYFYNNHYRAADYFNGLVPSELHKYAIDNFVITGNKFANSKSNIGKCTAFIYETDVRYMGDSKTAKQHGDRGLNVIFSGNTFDDSRTSIASDDAIFFVLNKNDTKGAITCSNNKFNLSKSNYLVTTDTSSSGKFTFTTNDNTWGSTVTENEIKNNNGTIIFN